MEGLEIAAAALSAAGLLAVGWALRARVLGTRSHDLVFAAAMALLACVAAWGIQLWGEPLDLYEPGWGSRLSVFAPALGFVIYAVEHHFLGSKNVAPTESAERKMDLVTLLLGLVLLGCAGAMLLRG